MAFCINLVSLIVLAVGALIHIVSIAVPYYGNYDVTATIGTTVKMEFTMGIWSYCLKTVIFDECWQYGEGVAQGLIQVDAPDWLKACEAMSLIGLFVVAGAGVLAILAMIQRICADHIKVLPYMACIFSAIGGVIILIGAIIFAAKFSTDYKIQAGQASADISLSWAFALDIVACVVIFVAAILFFVTGRKGSSSSEAYAT